MDDRLIMPTNECEYPMMTRAAKNAHKSEDNPIFYNHKNKK